MVIMVLVKRLYLHYTKGKTKEKFDEFRDNYYDYLKIKLVTSGMNRVAEMNNKTVYYSLSLHESVKQYFYAI
jgi:hypothetical protein